MIVWCAGLDETALGYLQGLYRDARSTEHKFHNVFTISTEIIANNYFMIINSTFKCFIS
jgi:hypothetical protein